MSEMQMSIRSIEHYLLATAMSPKLQQVISRYAASARAGSTCVQIALSTFSDSNLVQEMESLRKDSSNAILKKRSLRNTLSLYSVDRGVADAVRGIQEEGYAAESECSRRLVKTQKVLKSMFLHDFIGSLDHGGSTAQTRSDISLRVSVSDLKESPTTATMTILCPDEPERTFALSARTLVVLRKIIQPQPNARSATFEFTGNRCKMKMGVESVKDSMVAQIKKSVV